MKKILTSVLALVLLVALVVPAALADANIMYVTRKNVHVFAQASKDSKVIGKVKYGEKLLIEKKKGKFYAILWAAEDGEGQRLGWIQAKSLGKNPPSSKKTSDKKKKAKESTKEAAKKTSKKKTEEAPDYRDVIRRTLSGMQPVSEYYAEIHTKSGQGSVALRLEPHVSGRLIYNLEEHHQLRVLAEGDGWDQVVDDEGGYTGYVSDKYLRRIETVAETPVDLTDDAFADANLPAAVVAPIVEDIDVNNLEDGVYAVSFNRNDLLDEGGELTLRNLRVFHVDHYEADAIEALKAGDTLIVSGRPVAVNAVALDGDTVNINGGMDADGGVTLDKADDTYIVNEYDYTTYSEYGSLSLPLDGSATYVDGADIDNPEITAEHDAIVATIMASERDDFTADNTTVTVLNGVIVEIHRFYTP